jgi:hypothetical protein
MGWRQSANTIFRGFGVGWGLQEIADAGRFVVERLQQAAGTAPHLAPQIQALATAYGMG